MSSRKTNVDKEVDSILSRSRTETERRLQGLKVAILYSSIEEYVIAKQYVEDFIKEKPTDPQGHKLLGDIHEALGDEKSALVCYKNALEHGGHGYSTLILKISEIVCSIGSDAETLKYWLEKCENVFPKSCTTIRLKAHELAVARTNADHGRQSVHQSELELHIQLIRYYMNTNQWKTVYDVVLRLNKEAKFEDDIIWFDLMQHVLMDIDEKTPEIKQNHEYNILKLYILRNYAYLCMGEADLKKCVNALKRFDKYLKEAISLNFNDDIWLAILQESRSQLFYLAGVIIFKKTQLGLLPLEDAQKFSGACFLASLSFDPISHTSTWIKEVKFYKWWWMQSYDRYSQVGHLLYTLANGNILELNKSIKSQIMTVQGHKQICQILFEDSYNDNLIASSFFCNAREMVGIFRKLKPVTLENLSEIDEVAFKVQLKNLSSLLWLCLQYYTADMIVQPNYSFLKIKNFPFGIQDLPTCMVDKICQVDILVFLMATVQCTASRIKCTDRPNQETGVAQSFLFPVCLKQNLCTEDQALWWSTAYEFITNTSKSSVKQASLRSFFVFGIELVRLVDSHGLSLQLLVHIAKSLDAKAEQHISNEKRALEHRAADFWNQASSQIKTMERENRYQLPTSRLFKEPGDTDLTQDNFNHLKSEVIFATSLIAMKESEYTKAVNGFRRINSPIAKLYMAKALRGHWEKSLFETTDSEESSSSRLRFLLEARSNLYELQEIIDKEETSQEFTGSVIKELNEIELMIHHDQQDDMSVKTSELIDHPYECIETISTSRRDQHSRTESYVRSTQNHIKESTEEKKLILDEIKCVSNQLKTSIISPPTPSAQLNPGKPRSSSKLTILREQLYQGIEKCQQERYAWIFTPHENYHSDQPNSSESSTLQKFHETQDIIRPQPVHTSSKVEGNHSHEQGQEKDDTTADVSRSPARHSPVVTLDIPQQNEDNVHEDGTYTQIFRDECRLFYFDKEFKRWRKIGAGTLEILKSENSLQYRIMMRNKRDNSLCVNHLITCQMKVTIKDLNKKSLTYWVKDEQSEHSGLCLKVRFGNMEKASHFAEVFDQCSKRLKESQTVEDVPNFDVRETVNQSSSMLSQENTEEDSYVEIFGEESQLSYFDNTNRKWITIYMGVLIILKKKNSLQFKIIMRRNKDNSICADHHITSDMKLLQKDDESYTYWAKVTQSEPMEQCLQVTFADREKAKHFSKIFSQCCRKLNETAVSVDDDAKILNKMFSPDLDQDSMQVGEVISIQADTERISLREVSEHENGAREDNTTSIKSTSELRENNGEKSLHFGQILVCQKKSQGSGCISSSSSEDDYIQVESIVDRENILPDVGQIIKCKLQSPFEVYLMTSSQRTVVHQTHSDPNLYDGSIDNANVESVEPMVDRRNILPGVGQIIKCKLQSPYEVYLMTSSQRTVVHQTDNVEPFLYDVSLDNAHVESVESMIDRGNILPCVGQIIKCKLQSPYEVYLMTSSQQTVVDQADNDEPLLYDGSIDNAHVESADATAIEITEENNFHIYITGEEPERLTFGDRIIFLTVVPPTFYI